MSQGSVIISTTPPLTGAALVSGINTALGALSSMNAGASAPTLGPGTAGALAAGQLWLDTSTAPRSVKIYDSASWVTWGSLDASAHTFSGAFKSVALGTAGSVVGTAVFANATSGTITLQPVTGALGSVTLSLPAATDTLVGKATTDVFTNKTFNSAGTGNVMQISGVTVARGQLPGTATNDAATAGNIGETISGTAAINAVTLGTGTPANVLASPISLTAGNWLISGVAYFSAGATTTMSDVVASISTTSATHDFTVGVFAGFSWNGAVVANNSSIGMIIPPFRVSVAGTTSYYLVATGEFGISTLKVGGFLSATRCR